MVEGYHAPSHGSDIPVPALRGTQGLVPAMHSLQHPPPWGSAPAPHPPASRRGQPALAQPSQAPRALCSALAANSRGQPHEHCPAPVASCLPHASSHGWGSRRVPLYPPSEPCAGHQGPLPILHTAPVPYHPTSPPASPLRALVGLLPPPPGAHTPPGAIPALTLAGGDGSGQAAAWGRQW